MFIDLITAHNLGNVGEVIILSASLSSPHCTVKSFLFVLEKNKCYILFKLFEAAHIHWNLITDLRGDYVARHEGGKRHLKNNFLLLNTPVPFAYGKFSYFSVTGPNLVATQN